MFVHHGERHQRTQTLQNPLVLVEIDDQPRDVCTELPGGGDIVPDRSSELKCPLEALHTEAHMMVIRGQLRTWLVEHAELFAEVQAVAQHVLPHQLLQGKEPLCPQLFIRTPCGL